MLPPPKILAGVALVILGGVVIIGAFAPLSLSTDVGLTDDQVCDAVASQRGTAAVDRLVATGFPHASDAPVEVYELARNGDTKAAVRIDWTTREAECLDLNHTAPVTARFEMTSAAYGALVGEIRTVIETGHLARGHALGNYFAVAFGTDVELPGRSVIDANAYEWSLANYAAGRLA